MSRIETVSRRYDAAGEVADRGVAIFAVGDPAGAQLNTAIRRALYVLGEERSAVWDELLQMASALRWRRLSQPQPNEYQPTQVELVAHVVRRATRLRGLVSDESLLDGLSAGAQEVGITDSPVGAALLDSIREVGTEKCLVVASRIPARVGMEPWLAEHGVGIVVPSDLNESSDRVEQTYVVGPPAFLPPSVVLAPLAPDTTFVIPSWFGNRSLPSSSLGPHAEGRIVVQARVFTSGDTSEPAASVPEQGEIVDEYLPQPVWGERTSGAREPGTDEVEARKILLCGDLALWLDDGERIRSLHPRQPVGERVGDEAVSDVDTGVYLVLRDGANEAGMMYEEALTHLGPSSSARVLATQERWKTRLRERLDELGNVRAVLELRERGVRAARQARAWTEPRLICPQRESDFALLLDWLGEPEQPAFGNAILLRRAVYKASADITRELERAVDRADLQALERDGVLHLEIDRDGFRGITVARVRARAPFTEIVNRRKVRVPFDDRTNQWLE